MDFNSKDFLKVKIVSCVEAPPLPGERPKQAVFLPDIQECNAYLHIHTGNVWFQFHKYKRVLMIGVGNIKFTEPYWEETLGKTEDATGKTTETNEARARGPGRPKLQPIPNA